MIYAVVENNFLICLIQLVIYIITILLCSLHLKKYGFLQGIFSIICLPILMHGVGVLLGYIFRENLEMEAFFHKCVLGFDGIVNVFKYLFRNIGIKWFYETGGFYLPFGVIFVLTYGYSITLRKKRKKKNKNTNDDMDK